MKEAEQKYAETSSAGARVAALHRVRFAAFEVDLRSGELRKHGIKVKLQEKPFQILALLLEQPGEVVTREELQRRLWPADTFVDFDSNLNTAANRLRQALGDSAESPRFVETLPRRGYRLIVPVEYLNGAHAAAPPGVSKHPEPYTPAPGHDGAAAKIPGESPRAATAGRHSTVLLVAVALLFAVAAVPRVRDSVWAMLPSAALPSTSFGASKTMLVVLPFENLSGDPQQDYISDGLTEEMIAQIGRLNPQRIGVIARTSSMHYKGTRKSVAEIGEELGVDYALEGSVRRVAPPRSPQANPATALRAGAAGRVRITAQLVAVRDQTPLWSETYERDEFDLSSVQQDVAAQIASTLAVELLPSGPPGRTAPHPSAAPRVNPEAYEAYLLGRYSWNKRTAEGLSVGLHHFQRAVRLDPNYAAAHAGIADSYLVLAGLFALPPQEAYPKAKQAAQRALQINPHLAEAHASLAGVTFQYDWDWARAEQEFRRAIELNPGYATAHQWYAAYLSAMGRHQEALREIETARRLDPLSLVILTTEGILRYQARQYDQALAACQKALDLARGLGTDFFLARVCVATVYVKMARGAGGYGHTPVQRAEFERKGVEQRYQAMVSEGVAKEDQERFWRAYATEGIQGAQRWLIAYRAQRLDRQYVPGYYMAVLYGALGENDQAFEWLERSYQQRDSFLTRLKVDPNLDPLRSDPRFATLLERMKLK